MQINEIALVNELQYLKKSVVFRILFKLILSGKKLLINIDSVEAIINGHRGEVL